MKFAEAERERYLSDPNFCPSCGHTEITDGKAEFDENYIWRSAACDACDAEWHDVYQLINFEMAS